MTTVVCDLDGVVYRGDTEVEGSATGLRRLIDAGFGLLFVTNNSARTPDEVASKITRVTGWEAAPGQVVTSAMAATSILDPEIDSPALVVGENGIKVALSEAGIEMTEDPSETRCVITGICRHISYDLISNAGEAIRSGARYVATNVDPTFPVEGGLKPGAGVTAAAVTQVGGIEPEVAGKPHRPMIDLINKRASGKVWVIGDRHDTDIELAAGQEGWNSILVMTGVTGPSEVGGSEDHVRGNLLEAVDLVIESTLRQ